MTIAADGALGIDSSVDGELLRIVNEVCRQTKSGLNTIPVFIQKKEENSVDYPT